MPEREIQFNELQVGMNIKIPDHGWELSIHARGYDWIITRVQSNHIIFLEPHSKYVYFIDDESSRSSK